MDWLTFIAVCLIVYRISTDIAYMDGPLDVFARFRGAVVQRFGSNHWISHGVMCPVCLSFWFAIILSVVMMDWRMFAASGFTTLIVRSTRS